MNEVWSQKVIEIKPSRTIEIISVSSIKKQKTFFLYNYEGKYYSLFENKVEIRKFFNCEESQFLSFEDDESIDLYLLNCSL